MPKMKTDKGAAAVKITGTGRLRRRHTMRAHILEKGFEAKEAPRSRGRLLAGGRVSGEEVVGLLIERAPFESGPK